MQKNTIPIKKNSIHDVLIDGWSADGSGVAHIDGYGVFIPKTIKGEKWTIKIVKVKNSAIYGIPLKLLEESPDRIHPSCPYYGKCGGCHTAHMTYEKELSLKLENVNNTLHHVGNLDITIPDIIPSGKKLSYRNKSICAVGLDDTGKHVISGFYQQRSHRIIPVDNCLLQSDESNIVNRVITDWMNKEHIQPYDEETRKGTVRHIFTRKAEHTDDFVVCIISARGFGSKTESLAEELRARCPFITGIVLNINKTKGNTILTGDFYTLWGDPCIHDSLNHVHFNIAPQAFFQVNPLQAEKLYSKVADFANLSGKETVLDLYCGTGTIGLSLANRSASVIGIEIIQEAIENAIANAELNHIDNASFYCEDASIFADNLTNYHIAPNVIVVDPPRKGLTDSVIDSITKMAPSRIIYVSCNPATLARDLNMLIDSSYDFYAGCAVDMFPRTNHVETVVCLSNKKSKDCVEIGVDAEDYNRIKDSEKEM